MRSVANRPFFSADMLVVAGLVIVVAMLLSHSLAGGLARLLF